VLLDKVLGHAKLLVHDAKIRGCVCVNCAQRRVQQLRVVLNHQGHIQLGGGGEGGGW